MFVSGDDPSIEVSSSQPSHVIYEKEEKIKIDYSGLTDNLQDLDDGDDVRKVEKNLEKQINEIANTIQRIQVRNMINSTGWPKCTDCTDFLFCNPKIVRIFFQIVRIVRIFILKIHRFF